ncbi:hypothetical protein ACFYKX_07850 [Cytobacillus sp. FJAT-54145]|uniref:Uncharacterized protein n=1 Tax=Cytobacillus spartinae TaxID=3299023 RepID=A0ABW6K8K3_9BACI
MIWNSLEGINMWKLNRMLKKLAYSNLALKEQIRDNALIIPLPSKTERVLTSQSMKEEIVNTIKSLDGFETLKVCLLENCKPVYREQLSQYGVTRWLEIPLQQVIEYDFSFTNIKQINPKTYKLSSVKSQYASR